MQEGGRASHKGKSMCKGPEVGIRWACLRKSRKRSADWDHPSHLQTAILRSHFLSSAMEGCGSEGGTLPHCALEKGQVSNSRLGILG